MFRRLNTISHLPAAQKGSSEGQPGSELAQVQPPRFPTRVFPRAESAILLLLVGMFLWRGFIPGWKTLNTDFSNYYLAARLYRQGSALDQVYDWAWFIRQKDHAGID